jgi:HSP20 family protein
MNITRWDPFREVEDVFRRYSPFLARPVRREGGEALEWTPVADISENEKEFVIKAELPEVKKEDVKVTLQDGALTISGERKHEKKQKGENEIRVESFYGTFSRTFSLPENVDTKSIHAEAKDGVLRVHVPKVAGAKSTSTQIAVK